MIAMSETMTPPMDPHKVVLRPLVTEKGTHQSERYNAYSFEVSPRATKEDIKHAVEALWDVRVARVRTLNRKGKPRRTKMKVGRTGDWKKAIVELHPDDRIAFF
jgi:large subunit ribosomal protein L23